MGFEFDQEIVEEFLMEARGHILELGSNLQLLETQGDNPDSQLLKVIYRGLHTVKGAAGFLTLDKVCELSVAMEDLVFLVQNGELIVGSRLVQLLLQGVDQLKQLLENTQHHEDFDISYMMNRLENFLTRQVPNEIKKNLKQVIPLSFPGGKDAGFTISEYTRKQVQKEGELVYVLKFDLDEIGKTKRKTPLLLIKELLETGEILDGKIETPLQDLSQQVKNTPLFYEVLYLSGLSKKRLEKRLDLDPQRVHLVLEGKQEPQTLVESFKEDEPADIQNESPGVSSGPLDRLEKLVSQLAKVRDMELERLDLLDPKANVIFQRLDIVTSKLQNTVNRMRKEASPGND
jgi:chemotaxis protein histidine kinase CheA